MPTDIPLRRGTVKRSRKPPARKPRPTGVFGGLAPATAPLQRAQRVQHQRVQRARAKLPPRPVPQIPVLPHYTPRQQATARDLIHRSVHAQAGGRHRTGRSVAAVNADLMADPRTRAQLAGILLATAQRQRGPAFVAQGTSARHSQRVGIGPATITINPHSLEQSLLQAVAPTLANAGDPATAFVKRGLGDVGTLATSPVIAGYELAAGAKDLATGHGPGRLEHLASGVVKGVTQSAPAALVTGHPGLAAKRFKQHPVLEAMNFLGAEALLGRGAGAVARGATGGRVGATIRQPIALSEDPAAVRAGAYVERRFSKDVLRKQVQRATERRVPLRDEQGRVVTVRQGNRDVPVLRPVSALERDRLLKREGDFRASRANATSRMTREEAGHARLVHGELVRQRMRPGAIHGRKARDAVSMVADGTILTARTFRRDLQRHIATIEDSLARHARGEPVYRHTGELEAARARLGQMKAILADRKVTRQADRIVQEGVRHGAALTAAEPELARVGVLSSAERARRARLVNAAVSHMGAYHGKAPHLTAEADRLRKVERSLQARLNFHAKDPAAKATVRAQLGKVKAARANVDRRNTERLRDPSGAALEPNRIEAHLASQGRDPASVAYLPYAESTRQFHKQFRPGGRGMLDNSGATRTGEQFRKGATESSAGLLRAQGVRQSIHLTQAREIDSLVHERGVRHPALTKANAGAPLSKAEARIAARGGYFTAKEAAETADRVLHDTGEELVPMTAHSSKLSEDTRRVLRDDVQSPAALESLGQRLLNDRIVNPATADPRARNVVLVPAQLVERLNAHLRPAGEFNRLLQMVNRPFRFAVLSQFRWLTGNFVEPYLVRLPLVGSGLTNVFGLGLDIHAAGKVLRQMEGSKDPRVVAAARQVRAQQFGGLFIGGRGLSNRRTLADDSKLYGAVVQRLPAVKTMGDMTSKLARVLMAPANGYFVVNRAVIEQWAQRAALGHEVRRDIQEFTGSWLQTVRLGQRAVGEASRGLVNTPTQLRYMRAQHELLGKYEGFSPKMRTVIQGPMPFLPWTLNSARFTLWTLPAHHSAVAALLAQTANVVKAQWAADHADAPPGSLKYAARTKDGGYVDFARYTPWGLTTPIVGSAGKDLQGLTSQVVPPLTGVLAALSGKDAFGRDLQVSKTASNPQGQATGGQQLGIALNSAAEALTPYVSSIRRLREGGGTAYANSTIFSPKTKPGSKHMSAARRTFDPLRPTYLRAPSGSGGSSGAGLDAIDREALRRATQAQAGAQLDPIDQAALDRALKGR